MTQPPTKRPYDRESYILVVDDDETLLKFFKIHLNKFFSRVIVVKNAKEAVETLKTKEIDLILSDLRMPRTDGLQLLKKIRNHNASIPVYLISGALIEEEQEREIAEVADGFLRKPFTIEDISAFIEQGMKKRELLRELSQHSPDNKSLLHLIQGKKSSKSLPERAQQLLKLLKAAS